MMNSPNPAIAAYPLKSKGGPLGCARTMPIAVKKLTPATVDSIRFASIRCPYAT